MRGDSAAARFTGSTAIFVVNLGLANQALCLRLLRRLKEFYVVTFPESGIT